MAKKMASAKKESSMIEKLSHYLADTFVLYAKTLNFHWNMVGPQFYMYHKLLDDQYHELAEAADTIAERIRMLRGVAPATLREFLNLASQSEPKGNLTWQEMIRELTQGHEVMIAHAHKLIEFADSIGDQGSSDLLIDRLRAHDKQAWLLRSHFEK